MDTFGSPIFTTPFFPQLVTLLLIPPFPFPRPYGECGVVNSNLPE